jgi:threonine dehydratase
LTAGAAKARNLTLYPFDDPRHCRTGYRCLEILTDAPDVDVVLVACGGGGLISGVAAAVKRLKPSARIVGIEPEGAAGMSMSLAAGSPQRVEKLDTIADGLAAPYAGTHNLAHVQAFVDEMIRIPDSEILAGMRVLMERCKLFAEPSAGAAVAPLLTGRVQLPADSCVIPIVCGGNIDLERLKRLI